MTPEKHHAEALRWLAIAEAAYPEIERRGSFPVRVATGLAQVHATLANYRPPAAQVCATCGQQPPEGLLDTPWGPVCKARCQIRRAGPHPAAEMVWLGDLSGYQLDADAGQVLLRHRCGWTYEVDNPVIAYLANLIDGPVSAHRDAGCNPHEG